MVVTRSHRRPYRRSTFDDIMLPTLRYPRYGIPLRYTKKKQLHCNWFCSKKRRDKKHGDKNTFNRFGGTIIRKRKGQGAQLNAP